MPALVVVVSQIMADFWVRFAQVAESAASEQLRFKPALQRFGAGVIIAVAAPAPARLF